MKPVPRFAEVFLLIGEGHNRRFPLDVVESPAGQAKGIIDNSSGRLLWGCMENCAQEDHAYRYLTPQQRLGLGASVAGCGVFGLPTLATIHWRWLSEYKPVRRKGR